MPHEAEYLRQRLAQKKSLTPQQRQYDPFFYRQIIPATYEETPHHFGPVVAMDNDQYSTPWPKGYQPTIGMMRQPDQPYEVPDPNTVLARLREQVRNQVARRVP